MTTKTPTTDDSDERERLMARNDLTEPERVRLAHLMGEKIGQLVKSIRDGAGPALAKLDQMHAQARAMAAELEALGEADALYHVVCFARGGEVTSLLACQLLAAADQVVFYAGMDWDRPDLERARKSFDRLEQTLLDREEDLAEREALPE